MPNKETEDFTGKYIEKTYEKVIHLSDDNYLVNGTGSIVLPIVSGSFEIVGDLYITCGSVYINGNALNIETSSYSLTSSYALNIYGGIENVAFITQQNIFSHSQIVSGSVDVTGLVYEQQNSGSITRNESGSILSISIDKDIGTHTITYQYDESGSVSAITSSLNDRIKITEYTRDDDGNVIKWEIK